MSTCAVSQNFRAVSCPSCRKRLRIPSGLKSGTKVSCRSCGEIFRFKEHGASSPTSEPSPSAGSHLPHNPCRTEHDSRSAGETDNGALFRSTGPTRHRSRTKAVLVVTLCFGGLIFCEVARRAISSSIVAKKSTTDGPAETSTTGIRQHSTGAQQTNDRTEDNEPPPTKTSVSSDTQSPSAKPVHSASTSNRNTSSTYRFRPAGRNHRAEYQAYLNAEAALHQQYAQRAREQESAIRAEAYQMQADVMRRQSYEFRTRLNNVAPGLQPIPSQYVYPYQ
jgi:hypothetical protein